MNPILLHLLTSLAYLVLAAYLWRNLQRWSQPQATRSMPVARALVAIPLVIHCALLAGTMLRPDGLYLGVGNAVSAIIALAVLIYWVASFFHRLEALYVLVLPAAAVLLLLPVFLPASGPLENTEFFVFKAHLLIALLAYSLFTVASLHVLLMAVVEKRLHTGDVPSSMQALPSLLAMESVLFQIIGSGFIFLTLTLATGVLYSEELFGKALTFSHKTLFGFISWLIFAALLVGRRFYGWRGRVAVRWTLAGFMALILAYIGSSFVVEIILRR
jgi:ABC-type uncharacterized transport system permease subunit